MRILALILSVYFTFLSVLGCADTPTSNNMGTVVSTTINSHIDHEHQHNNEGLNDCSPVCSCHCCHIHITFTDVAQTNIFHSLSSNYMPFKLNYKGRKSFDFFVPPQVVV